MKRYTSKTGNDVNELVLRPSEGSWVIKDLGGIYEYRI